MDHGFTNSRAQFTGSPVLVHRLLSFTGSPVSSSPVEFTVYRFLRSPVDMRLPPHFALGRSASSRPRHRRPTTSVRRWRGTRPGGTRLVEIGVWHGVTTSVLWRAMAPDGVLWAIDPFPRGRFGFSYQRRIARSEAARVTNGTVRWVRTTGELAAQIYRSEGAPPTGLVFIDGDHSYEALAGDWSAWSSLVAKGGVVCLHDSRSTPERQIDDAGSVIATERIVKRDPAFEVVEEGQSNRGSAPLRGSCTRHRI